MSNNQFEQDIYSKVFEFILWLTLAILSIIFAPLFIIFVIIGAFISYKIGIQNSLLAQQTELLKQLNAKPSSTNQIPSGIFIDKKS